MEWITEVVGVIGSSASGGIFGLIGSLGGAVVKYFQKKSERAFQKEKWAHEDRMFELQMQRDRQEDEHELAVVSQAGAWKGLDTSIKSDMSTSKNNYPWVNAIKSCYRPFITTVLVILSYMMFRDILGSLLGDTGGTMVQIFSMTELKLILRYMVYSLVFATSTSIVWWFGDRAFAPPGMKNR